MRRRWLAGLLTLGLCLGCAGLVDRPEACDCDEAAEPAPQIVLTVAYFDNLTGDDAYDVLGKGVADMMVTDLASVPWLRVVERARFEAVLQELALQQSEFFDPSTAAKIGEGLGATHVVTGAVSALAPDMRIDIRLVDVASGEVAMADKVVGDPEAFFAMQEELSSKFVGALYRVQHPRPERADVPRAELLLDYARALDQADRGDAEAAQSALRSLSEQPDFGLARDRYSRLLRTISERSPSASP